ncbi:transglycosylase family protein [Gephyromycinifex aptenodytis]|uniref:transglycosylase family protein n=1 Tax=Gephyromycinifex aptenodytis TaxID=2716227 RepID=UPI001448346B|nr:transglycosylase family protein [Gephyromycinifex aptenodytis]
MHYTAKHRAAQTSRKGSRTLGAAILGGATIIGGLATAPMSAEAASSNVWDRVAACESGGNWGIATGNGYYGGLQFSASSWRAAGGTRYASLPHRASRAQQIAAAQNLLRMQGPGAWPVCSRKAGLNRSNGLSSGGGAAASRGHARKAVSKSHSNRYRNSGLSVSSVKKLQRKVGARVDGIVGPETVRKTERALGFTPSGKRQLLGSTYRGALRIIR